MIDIDAVTEKYIKAFPDAIIPRPAFIGDDAVAAAMLEAIDRGRPITRDYDWYGYLPPGAVA